MVILLPGIDDTPSYARLVIEKGGPYEKGAWFSLQQDKVILGRTTSVFTPDISFDNLLISRKHCCIEQHDGVWTICELNSKHGTMLNSHPLQQAVPSPLKHGDKIGLASGVVLLRFALSAEFERTLDYESTLLLQAPAVSQTAGPVVIDITKKALLLNNLEVSLSVKEWCLLEVLYKHQNRFVSYETIRLAVWAERWSADNKTPDVGLDEINILIYRLRRKLGDYGHVLKTRRGQGCILEIM